MSSNILITGAAGYVGGSIVADFRASNSPLLKAATITAVVRSEEQAKALSQKGINPVQVDLSNEQAVTEAVLRDKINIIVHCASGLEANLALNLIKALGERREASGEPTYFIHTSGGSAYSNIGGWPHGEVKDTDDVFDLEKPVADSNPLRKTNVLVTEQAKAHGVISYIVVPPLVYGRGRGEWNKLSVSLPRYIKGSIANKAVYKFNADISMPAVYVSDLTAYYALLVEKILSKEPPPSGEKGHYFIVAHSFHWWETLNRIAAALYARGLVTEPTIQVWPSDEKAAESLGIPVQFMHLIWNSKTKIVAEKKHALGWQPVWNREEEFLQNLDDEVQAVLELDKPRSSVFDALNASSSK